MLNSRPFTPRLLAVLAVLVATAAIAPSAASARIPGFVGLVSDDLFKSGDAYREQNMDKQAATGISYIRQNFHWSSIERRRGRFTLADYDKFVVQLARRRIAVLPILISSPSFYAAPRRRGARRIDACPPRNPRDFQRFATELVRRYGRNGSLWRARPDVPKTPITAWQIWNEPNIPAFWCTGVSARSYVALLANAYQAIKRADRRAEVVTGAIPDARRVIPGSQGFVRFVTDLYRNRGARYFDTLATNTFGKPVSGTFRELQVARGLMNRNRDRDAKIWLTELGWATGGPRSPSRVSLGEQARRINGSLRALARQRGRRSLNLRGVIYYSWRDDTGPRPRRDFSGRYTGLLFDGGREKPGYRAFRDTVRALR